MLKSVKRANVKLGLALILLFYLILAATYSIIVPIGRGADEWAHYSYARFIAENGRLPLNPAEREIAGYKSDWPPLYHLFAAGLTAWVDVDGPPTFKYRADNIRRQLALAFGPEAILHTEDEVFPWQQEILVWHVGRFLSICFTLVALLVTYFIALEVFASSTEPKEQGNGGEETSHISRLTPHVSRLTPHISRFTLPPQTLALISVAVLAFNPRFLFTGMLFNYDSLTLLIASLFLWLAIRVAKGYHSRWTFWGLGALAGLALVTKYLTVLLPLEIVVLALSLRAGKQEGGRITYHVSRVTYHISRSLRPVAMRLGQATLAYLLVVSWWFGYLLVNFNEIDAYGPVLGTLAPLIRGDASDRTVEEIFAWLSGGQAPTPAYIEKQSYTAWQIVAELPTTFWGNPIIRPYPLNWFILTMTVVTIVAVIGLAVWWRTSTSARSRPGSGFKSRPRLLAFLLMLHCALPLPFMLVRLFGARDALEAVQGRHILFLAGPAVAILLVWGLSVIVSSVKCQVSRITHPCPETCPERGRRGSRRDVSRITHHASRITHYVLRLTFYALLGLLLAGAINQLIFMWHTYPPLLPVRTTPYIQQNTPLPFRITLPGGAELVDYHIPSLLPTPYSLLPTSDVSVPSLKVILIWQAGQEPPPEDYQTELALVDTQGQAQSGWRAYQTQAHYPTRAWESGDVIRDEGWLPLANVAAGDYEIRLRILGQAGEVVPWQSLMTYYTILKDEGGVKLSGGGPHAALEKWLLWQQGEAVNRPPTLRERETAQFTTSNEYDASDLQLVGPDGLPRPPISVGSTWANFIIGPDWPPGDYSLQNEIVLRVSPNERNFQVPAEMTHQLEANFENQVKLLGYRLPSQRVQPGDGLPITLYWQGLQWLGEDFVIFDRLLDNRQVAWGGYDRLPRENYSTLLWAPGEIVVDGFAVPVAADAPNGIYTLSLGWYRLVDGQAKSLLILNPETGELTEQTSVTIGPLKVGGPPPGVTITEATPQTAVNVVLGEQIELLGYDLTRQPTAILDFTFYWQTLAPIETDYTIFIHVRNAAGEIVSQKDTPPVNGAYPTSLWDTGEIVKDEISVLLENLEPGQYEVVIGMYDFKTGLRLPVGDSPDNTILLQSFEVSE